MDMVGVELFEFAQWAFGDHGLPKLELLAWGDFSQWPTPADGGHPLMKPEDWSLLVARRSRPGSDAVSTENNFRVISNHEMESAAPSVEQASKFLGACDPRYHYVQEFPGRSY